MGKEQYFTGRTGVYFDYELNELICYHQVIPEKMGLLMKSKRSIYENFPHYYFYARKYRVTPFDQDFFGQPKKPWLILKRNMKTLKFIGPL